jgi:hypothetical protein
MDMILKTFPFLFKFHIIVVASYGQGYNLNTFGMFFFKQHLTLLQIENYLTKTVCYNYL